MNQLFKDLDEPDHPVGGNEIAKLAEEDRVGVYDNLDDELEALEEIENQKVDTVHPHVSSTASRGMDIEKPIRPIKPSYQPYNPQATAPKSSSNDSFIKTLYTRQAERMKPNLDFQFYSKEIDNVEEKHYELELSEGKAQFYYIDIQEDFNHKSRVFVYGKVKVKGGDNVSCCLVVNNMERCYYFFKRENEQVVSLA